MSSKVNNYSFVDNQMSDTKPEGNAEVNSNRKFHYGITMAIFQLHRQEILSWSYVKQKGSTENL